jgi:hypothetical protein
MFRRKGEMYGSGNAGTATVASGYAGNWLADGDSQNGTITLQYRNGQTERLRYQKSGFLLLLCHRAFYLLICIAGTASRREASTARI